MYLRYVLLSFVIFLGKVLGRCFAGYLDKGQLFTITCQVARRLTHTKVIVFLDKKV